MLNCFKSIVFLTYSSEYILTDFQCFDVRKVKINYAKVIFYMNLKNT